MPRPTQAANKLGPQPCQGLRVQDVELEVSGLGLSIIGFRVEGLGFRVIIGFRV